MYFSSLKLETQVMFYIFSCDEKLKNWQCHSVHMFVCSYSFFLMYLECWKSFEASRECKSVSRACQACLKDVSWMFQGCFRHGINTHQATRIWFKHYLSKLGWWVSAIADLADAGGVGAQNYGTVAYVIFKCSLITTIPKISFFDQFRDFFHTHLYWNQNKLIEVILKQ